jgi:hypothetical protein
MEDLSEAFGLKPSASALDPETVRETDVSHGKHQTDSIQGTSSKATESGQGSSGLRACSLGEKKSETNDKVDPPADDDEGPGIEPNRPGTETPVGGQRVPPQHPGAPGRNHGTAVDWDTMQKDFLPRKGRRRIRSQDSPRGGFSRTSTPLGGCRAPSVRAPGSPPRRLHHHSIPCLVGGSWLGVGRTAGPT